MTNEILVVDDNSDIRLLISGILKDKGFSVREAANFDQAMNEKVYFLERVFPSSNLYFLRLYLQNLIIFQLKMVFA